MPKLSRTDDPGVRNAERTRRTLLDTTRRLLAQKGTGLTLAEVAQAAGISKSGLLHHYASRDALFLAAFTDTHERFHAEVLAHVNLAENEPGKLLRAYLRVFAQGSSDVISAISTSGFWGGVQGISGAEELASADIQRWQENLVADGLDADFVRIVRRSIEGMAAAVEWGEETQTDLERVAEALIQLTFDPPLLPLSR